MLVENAGLTNPFEIGLTSRSQVDGLTSRRNAGLTNPFDWPYQPITNRRPYQPSQTRVLPTRLIGLTSRSQSRWPYQPSQRGSYQPADWPYQPITETWLTLLSQSLKVWPGLLTQPGPALFYRPRPQREEKSKSHIPRTADILLHSPESCVFCRFYVAHRKWAKTPELLHC